MDRVIVHGGLFKTKMWHRKSLRMHVPVSVMRTEGGAWGIAILTSYMFRRKKEEKTNICKK